MRTVYRATVMSLGMVVSLALPMRGAAADKAGRLSGTVLSLDKSESQITLQQGTAHRVIEYNASTEFKVGSAGNTKATTASSADQVQAGNYVTCIGTWDNVKLAASRCVVRAAKRP
ncbi:MAG: hypothetical protein LAP40_10445 [Acidobacteriia bacterium]|nr:hypothetical protein [Terriglobia bacterium]